MNPHAKPFTLRQLQYAIAVAEQLSFRKAAELCRVSQPSLSAQIAQLETALSVQLFERNRRAVMVTPGGQALLERARRVLVEADDLLAVSKGTNDPLAGTIRIGVIPTVSPYLLPIVAPRLREVFQQLTLIWRESTTHDLVEDLNAGKLEAVLLALEAEIGDLDHEVIAEDAFVVAMRPEHALAKKSSSVTPAELRGNDVLLLDDYHCFRQQALAVCKAGRAREAEFRATSLTTLVQMVVGGAGITLLPALAAAEAKRADLHLRPIAAPGAQRTIVLAWRKQSPARSALRKIAAVVRTAFPRPAVAKSAAAIR